jgi:SAM-dependent methyltransferase
MEELKILELGCGTGIDISIISARNAQIAAYGSDISEKSISIGLRVAVETFTNVTYFVADTLEIPIIDNSIDIIFSQGLIEHFQNTFEVLREQVRILKKNGILIVNVPQKFTAYTIMKHWQMRSDSWELGFETEFSYNDLRKIGKDLNLLERDVCGYQYWKSWFEPSFVLRDLYNKFHRRNPWREQRLFRFFKDFCDTFWNLVEKRWGHYFLQNIVIVFEKIET